MILHARELHFPTVPTDLVEEGMAMSHAYLKDRSLSNEAKWWEGYDNILASPAFSEWCQKNVIIGGPAPRLSIRSKDPVIHRDKKITAKIIYHISLGNPNVINSFYDDLAGTNKLEQIQFELYKWYFVNADIPHIPVGMQPGEVRISFTIPLILRP